MIEFCQLLWVFICVLLVCNSLPVSSPYDWSDEVPWIFLICINVVAHLISSGVRKPYPYLWLPRIFWSLTLLKIPNRLPQIKYEFWNILGVSFTHLKWAPSVDIFRRSNIVHINTPFLWPIVFFKWDIKFPHDISNHWSDSSNFWFCRIYHVAWGYVVVFSMQCLR